MRSRGRLAGARPPCGAALAHQRPEHDRAEQIEHAEADEERRVADRRHQPADQQREDQHAGVAARAGHAGDRRHFVAPEQVRRHGDDRDRQRLVRESRRGSAARSPRRGSGPSRRTRRRSSAARPTVKAPRRALIRRMPAYFCSARLIVPPNRQPRSAARNGSQANSAICFRSKPRDGRQVERQPEGQRAPGRVGQEARERDAPEVALPEDRRRSTAVPSAREVRFLARGDVVALLGRERRMLSRLTGRSAARAPPRRGPSAPVITNANCQL